jgi:YHS domain-containing protein
VKKIKVSFRYVYLGVQYYFQFQAHTGGLRKTTVQ